MHKVIVLGGCGAVGSVAVATLTRMGQWSEIRVGDINLPSAEKIVSSLNDDRLRAVGVDVMDPAQIAAAIEGCDVVLNCVGPFYRSVRTVLETVLDAGINYVDVCDDVDVTLDILEWDQRARQSGTTALIGMGASPGTTNLFAKYIADNFLDECRSVDIFHTHGGEPVEGAGVIGHRFHCMSIPIPMYLDGQLRYVGYFDDDGIALRQTFNFPLVGDDIPIFPYPHPEQVTLPRYINLQQVTNKGSVLPMEYYTLTSEVCRLGLTSRDPLEVNGQSVIPYDVATAFLIRERERILQEQNLSQCGCMSVVVQGRKDGHSMEYRMHIASQSSGLGDGTGIPAAIGATLMAEGRITEPGVLPPEACVDPAEYLATALAVPQMESASTILIEQILPDGTVNNIPLADAMA